MQTPNINYIEKRTHKVDVRSDDEVVVGTLRRGGATKQIAMRAFPYGRVSIHRFLCYSFLTIAPASLVPRALKLAHIYSAQLILLGVCTPTWQNKIIRHGTFVRILLREAPMEIQTEEAGQLSFQVAMGLLERPGPRNREIEETLGVSSEELAKKCLGVLQEHPERLGCEHIKVIAGTRRRHPKLRSYCNQLYSLLVDHVDHPISSFSQVA